MIYTLDDATLKRASEMHTVIIINKCFRSNAYMSICYRITHFRNVFLLYSSQVTTDVLSKMFCNRTPRRTVVAESSKDLPNSSDVLRKHLQELQIARKIGSGMGVLLHRSLTSREQLPADESHNKGGEELEANHLWCLPLQ